MVIIAILGFLVWSSYTNHLTSMADIAQQEQELEQMEYEDRIEQEQKEYLTERKQDCYNYYEAEKEKWNNVKDQEYDEVNDVCLVWYEDSDADSKWGDQNCSELLTSSDELELLAIFSFRQYKSCENGWFYKTF